MTSGIDNERFLVFESPKGDLLAMWTQSSVETHGDNHLMPARSKDGLKWTQPVKLAGTGPGEQISEASLLSRNFLTAPSRSRLCYGTARVTASSPTLTPEE